MAALTWRDIFTGITGLPAPSELPARPITQFVVDSRAVVPGACFVARPGEQVDGHQFIPQAFAAGASAVLAEQDRLAAVGLNWENMTPPLTIIDLTGPTPVIHQDGGQTEGSDQESASVLIVTRNSLAAIQRLAGWWRNQATECRVVGVTGSVGKTTLKELVAAVLAQRYRTFKSKGNLNSDIGLPLTLLDMPLNTERAVLEMGMTRPGELTELAAFTQPEIAVVTNVGPSHLARMGSMEAITAAKAELVQALPAGGVAILNNDDARVRAMGTLAPPDVRVVTYGVEPRDSVYPDLWASDIVSHGLDGISFQCHYYDPFPGGAEQGGRPQTITARLPLLGRHSVHAALAAAAIGLVEGQSWAEIIGGLKNLEDLEVLRLMVVPGTNGSTLLDDTYNASPDSTLAALNLLADLPGRHVAILGDMRELGSYEREGHTLVAYRACEVCELLVTVGALGKLIADEALAYGFPAEALYRADTKAEAIEWLQGRLQTGDMVLIKGSRGLQMEEIVAALMTYPNANRPGEPGLPGESQEGQSTL